MDSYQELHKHVLLSVWQNKIVLQKASPGQLQLFQEDGPGPHNHLSNSVEAALTWPVSWGFPGSYTSASETRKINWGSGSSEYAPYPVQFSTADWASVQR